MQSPHYGECMAADWLDGARFADSNGYQNDFARNMSPWRDWVIAAFNKHMPYDQFVIEQIAGDLLPNPTLEQRIATGFNRNHRTVTEAGSIEDEWFVENVVDRVETMGTVMLGLTVGCARCHDHKFDPISQKEFYQLFAFFGNVNEKGVYTETRGNVPPLVKAITPENEKKLAEFDAKIAALNKQLADHIANIGPHRQAWLESLAKAAAAKRAGRGGRIACRRMRHSRPCRGNQWRRRSRCKIGCSGLAGRTVWRSRRVRRQAASGLSRLDFPPADQPFSWAVWVKPTGDGAILSKMDDCEEIARLRSVPVRRRQGRHAHHRQLAGQCDEGAHGPAAAADDWSHIVATYDGSSKAAGVALYVNGEKQEVDGRSRQAQRLVRQRPAVPHWQAIDG